MFRTLKQALILCVVFTALTGVAYPLMITGIAQVVFPHQANGSVITIDNNLIGSEVIGQEFSAPEYFWGRPSATSGTPYNAAMSGGSNYATTNPALLQQVNRRIQELREADPENQQSIPVDLVTASASGLDPHISPAAAYFQAPRVARTRGISLDTVNLLIAEYTSPPWLGLFGENRVNVLKLNMALDSLQ